MVAVALLTPTDELMLISVGRGDIFEPLDNMRSLGKYGTAGDFRRFCGPAFYAIPCFTLPCSNIS